MPDPIDLYLKTLVPPRVDRAEVAERRAKLTAVLDAHSLKAGYFIECGSFSHGTGIARKSDVDYIAWASATRPEHPSSALARLKEALRWADWKIDDLRISSPTVQVRYYGPPHFEIVPGFYKREFAGGNVFYIPGRGDEWVESAPAVHKRYVNGANDLRRGRVKGLVRLAKAWKYCVGAPVSSFYLEMRIAEYAKKNELQWHDFDLRYGLQAMISTGLRDMNDPAGIVGRIPACSSETNRSQVLRLMHEAVVSLEKAYECEKRRDSYGHWDNMVDVFGYDFPWPDW